MLLRACLSGLLLGATACVGLPELVRIHVDGRTIELRQAGFSYPVAGRWSTSPECGEGIYEMAELGRSVTRMRRIGPDELELTGSDGRVFRLHRCQP